jgi:Xaa-Pro aminopeptidase
MQLHEDLCGPLGRIIFMVKFFPSFPSSHPPSHQTFLTTDLVGTGHGVGAALNVHEGPQRISPLLTGRNYSTPLAEGMIVSIEPGYYETDAFGIRLENLYVVKRVPASRHTALPPSAGHDSDSPSLQFEALTFVPFQRNLIEISLLSSSQLAWIDSYHQEVLTRITETLRGSTSEDKTAIMRWLQDLCQPLRVK